MSHRVDDKRDALLAQGFTGSMSEMTLSWLQAAGATSPQLSDAWIEMLALNGYEGQRNDAWFEFLGDYGYVGALPDRDAAFWEDGGVLAPPLPLADWTIGQSLDLYGYGSGYGGLAPNGNGDVTVVRLDADNLSDVVTLQLDSIIEWDPIVIAAENIGVTTVTRTDPATRYEATDAAFTAAVVAELGNTNPVAALPAGIVNPPIWDTNIPNLIGTAGTPFAYSVAQHIAFNPYFPVTDYAIATGEIAGSDIDSAGLFTLDNTVAPGIYPISLTADNLVGPSEPSNVYTVELRTDPVIDVQPQDVEVAEPNGALFEIEASHPYGAALFYEWTTSRPLDTGPTDGASLTVLSTSAATDNGTQINCTVRAYSQTSGFFVTSINVTLAVYEVDQLPPVIDQQPDSLIVIEPDGGQFTMVASHPDGAPLIYQWLALDLDMIAWVPASEILTTTTDTSPVMVLTSTDASQNSTIVRGRARAYTDSPDYQVITDLALLSVAELVLSPPIIDQHPSDLNVIVPGGGQFTVVASHPDGALLLYDWSHQFIDVDPASQVQETLVLNSTSLQEDGLQTRCRVRAYNNSGDYQTFTEFATLNAGLGQVPPVIIVQPDPSIVIEPGSTSFTVEASHPDSADLFYMWQARDLGSDDPWVNAGDRLDDVTDQTEPTMLVNSTIVADTSDIRCRVRAYDAFDASYEVVTVVVPLVVVPDGEEPIWGVVPDLDFPEDDLPDEVEMSDYILSGLGLENWQLFDNPAGITIDDATGTVTIGNTTDPGTYPMTASVDNLFGTGTSEQFTWRVQTVPVVDTDPEDLFINEPEDGVLSAEVSHPDPDAPLFYWWEAFHEEDGEWKGLVDYFSDVSGATTDTCTLNSTNFDDYENTPVQARLVTQAYIVAPPGEGFRAITDEVIVDVDRPQADITDHPDDITVDEGDPASFSVTATHTSSPDIYYLWDASNDGGDTWFPPDQILSDVEPGSEITDTLVLKSTSRQPPEQDTPPEWSHVSDANTTEGGVAEYSRNMAPFVTSSTTITAWDTTFGDIDGLGVFTPPPDTLEGNYSTTISATNVAGTEDSNEWFFNVTEDGEEDDYIVMLYPPDYRWSFNASVGRPLTLYMDVESNTTITYEWTHIFDSEDVTETADGYLIIHALPIEANGTAVSCVASIPGHQPIEPRETILQVGSIWTGPPASDTQNQSLGYSDPAREYPVGANGAEEFEVISGPGTMLGDWMFVDPDIAVGDHVIVVEMSNSFGSGTRTYTITIVEDRQQATTGLPEISIITPSALEQLPLIHKEDISYLGSFGLPNMSPSFENGGQNITMHPDGDKLYLGHHLNKDDISIINIPEIGGSAEIVTTHLRIPRAPYASENEIIGALHHNGRLITGSYNDYDNSPGGKAGVTWSEDDLSVTDGTYYNWPDAPNRMWLGQYYGHIPPEWQAALGGPAFTGAALVSIRTSIVNGFSFYVFDPDDVGVGPDVASTPLMNYAFEKPMANMIIRNPILNKANQQNAGAVFINDSRSVLYIGTNKPGRPYYKREDNCGGHNGDAAQPSSRTVWAYDALDLLAVSNAARDPNDVMPYAIFELPDYDYADRCGRMRRSSSCWDPATRRIYIADGRAFPSSPRIQVFEVA